MYMTPKEKIKLLTFGLVHICIIHRARVALLEDSLAFTHVGSSFRDEATLGLRYLLLLHIDRA